VSVFVDSSCWFASVVARDRHNARAKAVLSEVGPLITTDHVIVETWLLLATRYHRRGAETFWDAIRQGAAGVEKVTDADMQVAWAVGEVFADQEFSIVDRTSFAAMERLGLTRVASFDAHFAVYRYGRNRDRAFEILR
jgi:predicted nucleic acid-binding protein